MYVFQDIISDDEMFTDVYKYEECEDGFCLKVMAKLLTRSDKFDDALIGANKSAEEQCEEIEGSSTSGLNVVLDNKLAEAPGFSKKQYVSYLKGYVKALNGKVSEENKKAFQEKAKKYLQKFSKMSDEEFKEYEFFQGEKVNADAMVILCKWNEDGISAELTFIKDGLRQEKL